MLHLDCFASLAMTPSRPQLTGWDREARKNSRPPRCPKARCWRNWATRPLQTPAPDRRLIGRADRELSGDLAARRGDTQRTGDTVSGRFAVEFKRNPAWRDHPVHRRGSERNRPGIQPPGPSPERERLAQAFGHLAIERSASRKYDAEAARGGLQLWSGQAILEGDF